MALVPSVDLIRIIILQANRDSKHEPLFLSYALHFKLHPDVFALHVPFPEMQDGFRKLRVPALYTCRTSNVVPLKSLGVLSRRIIVVQDIGALINFLDVARLRNSFSGLLLSVRSSSVVRYSWNRSRSPETECARRRAAPGARRWILFTVWFAYSVLLALARDSPWAARARSGVPREGSPRSVRKENIRNVSFILGLDASRVPAYWLAYNVRPNARLNSRKITSRIHAKRKHETRASAAASCCLADIVTHVDALNKLKRFRNSGEP